MTNTNETYKNNTEIQEHITKLEEIKKEYEKAIKGAKEAREKYEEMYKSLKDIRDGLLKGKLSNKQIKAFKKLSENI